MKTCLSEHLQDPNLLKLLAAEADEKSTTIREILIKALEGYFTLRIENRSLSKHVEDVFDQWNDPKVNC